MMIVISPAKTLDFSRQCLTEACSAPDMMAQSSELIGVMRKKSEAEIRALMGVSEKLAALNAERYRSWGTPASTAEAKQALLAFKGDVYQGLELDGWRAADFAFAQKHLRILSGLYGLLRPLDLIEPYRLEMGTRLKTKRGADLYQFWDAAITGALEDAMAAANDKVLINLASIEYFSAVQTDRLPARVVAPVFKDEKNGVFKIISFYAKRARGMMADFIIRHRLKNPGDLSAFNSGGYYFSEGESTPDQPVFLRAEQKK